MKKIIFAVLVILTFSLNSCYDEKMEWNDPYNHPDEKDLPLGLQEAISRYEALTAYTTMKLGVGIDFNLYMTDKQYQAIVNENFREITPGNELKQQSLMNTSGVLNFTYADAVIAKLQEARLSVYGHTLVWHQQQQAGYLNSLIAPVIVPAPAGESLIDGSFENGLDGFDPPYYKEAVTVTTEEAIEGSHSMKVAVGNWGNGKYDMQINSTAFPIIKGHHYEISFFIKSDIPGSVGIDFPNANLDNQYPWSDGRELTPTSTNWVQVTYNNEMSKDDDHPNAMIATEDNSAMTFRFLLGSTKNCTYYIDNVVVLDLDAEPTVVNMLSNGDFEGGSLSPWGSWGNGSSSAISAEGEGYNSKYAMVLTNPKNAQAYEAQAAYTFGTSLEMNATYKVAAMVKCSNAGSIQMEVQNSSTYSGQYSGGSTVGTSWQPIEWEFKATTNGLDRLCFDFGSIAGTYYVDNVVFSKVTETTKAASHKTVLRAGSITIPKTPEEKAAILEPVLQKYITDVVSNFAGKIVAWDVVNEPMNENGTVREGEENLKATNEFYWMYYLGKDYSVTAFKAARAADPAAKLFINDYNLESADGNKLNGLINYVKYIESQGAVIDGIGTQVHLNINYADTTAINTMFQKLAATGKLIKISELDIAVNTDVPALALATEQARLYEMIVKAYKKYVPEAQQYGITVWGVSDNEKEHEYWLKNDAPCLWNAKYARKHAYKGFADGLAGRDVSVDFPGTLVP